MPRRIQRKRIRGWRMPDGAVSVTRPGRFGNPFRTASPADRAACVAKFRRALLAGELRVSVDDVKHALRARDLACWCRLPEPGEPDLCHAAVLLEVANLPNDEEMP